MSKVIKQYPDDVLAKAKEVYYRPGMVWQNVPAVLDKEFGMRDGDELYHNHGLCAAVKKKLSYVPKRKRAGFMSKAKAKAFSSALTELGITIPVQDIISKAASKLSSKKTK